MATTHQTGSEEETAAVARTLAAALAARIHSELGWSTKAPEHREQVQL